MACLCVRLAGLTSESAGDLSGAGAGGRSVPSAEPPLTYEETLAGGWGESYPVLGRGDTMGKEGRDERQMFLAPESSYSG